MKTSLPRLAALAAALGLAACSSVGGMMGGSTEHLTLTGTNETPAVDTSASGSGTVTVGPDRTVHADITVTGMQATMAHIHEAPTGKAGKVIIPLTEEGANHFVSPPGAKLTEEQYEAYKAGNLYVNVHSAQHKAGEVRAQLAAR